jgi:hypothetical protein
VLKWTAPPTRTLFLKFVEPQIENRCVTRRHFNGSGLCSLALTERSLAMLKVGAPPIPPSARANAITTDRFIVPVHFTQHFPDGRSLLSLSEAEWLNSRALRGSGVCPPVLAQNAILFGGAHYVCVLPHRRLS